MAEKISVTTMLFLLVVVIVVSVIGTTYAVANLGLIKYPESTPASTGLVTVTVRPSQVTVKSGEVAVNVIQENLTPESGGAT